MQCVCVCVCACACVCVCAFVVICPTMWHQKWHWHTMLSVTVLNILCRMLYILCNACVCVFVVIYPTMWHQKWHWHTKQFVTVLNILCSMLYILCSACIVEVCVCVCVCSNLPYDVAPEVALAHEPVRDRIKNSMQCLQDMTEYFLSAILASVDKIP